MSCHGNQSRISANRPSNNSALGQNMVLTKIKGQKKKSKQTNK